MRIVSLDLENIKSYIREQIPFTDGLNAVVGLNGSGKTTILEAIGYALFDYLPYKQDAFVREGQRSGTIRVRLADGDGREYEVVRKFGLGSAYYVADIETGARLAERDEAVKTWMQQHALGVDPEVDLGALFKNAVGVPQGQMTGDFLVTPAARQKIFDPLLRVEEYKKAYKDLLQTVNYLKAYSDHLDGEIGQLQQTADQIPGVLDHVQEVESDIAANEIRLAERAAQLTEVSDRKGVLDTLEGRIYTLRTEDSAASAQVRARAEMLTLRQAELEQARRARASVQAAEPGQKRYLEAEIALQTLEGERQERDRLERQRGAALAAMRVHEEQLRDLDNQVQAAIAAADEARALASAVARQEALESRQREVQMALREETAVARALPNVESQIANLERRIADTKTGIEAARRDAAEARDLGIVSQQVAELRETLTGLDAVRAEAKSVEEEGRRLRKERDALTAAQLHHAELSRQAAEQEQLAAALPELRERLTGLLAERAHAHATIQYQDQARASLVQGHCPLLDLTCPVVTATVGVLDRFDERVAALSAQVKALDGDITRTRGEVAVAETADQAAQSLRLDAARQLREDVDEAALQAALQAARERYADLQAQVAGEAEVRARLATGVEREKALTAAAARAGQLSMLEGMLAADEDTLRTQSAERTYLVGRLRELDTLKAEDGDLRAQLTELGDPRARQAALRAQADTRADIENRRQETQGVLQGEADTLRAVVGQLARYTHLDEKLASWIALRDASRADHELCLANSAEAEKVEERTAVVAELESLLAEARRKQETVAGDLAEVEGRYNAQAHAALRAEYDDLQKAMGAETQRRDDLQSRLEREMEILAGLRRQEQHLLTRRAERDETGQVARAVTFIRETLRAAGPVVTESLLSTISQIANDIFCEIMDDHAAELRWDKDYEVIVQKGPEERPFAQLSGGEKMSAALSVRLALLREMTEVDVAFFDEPTQNMDGERRTNLAEQIRAVKGFNQLIVISHDDTFEHHTDNLIRLRKESDETHLEPV